jgi:hypothetical protein
MVGLFLLFFFPLLFLIVRKAIYTCELLEVGGKVQPHNIMWLLEADFRGERESLLGLAVTKGASV